MVQVRSLVKNFDQHTVLNDITFDAQPGEILAIMGSSGGGKTTLLRCISGLILPTSGQIHVDGIDVERQPEEARTRMGMVFQSSALFDFMDVIENVLFGIERHLKLEPEAQRKLALESLNKVGIDERDANKMPDALSGGMRKRVGAARALALNPKVMLYDEPTTGLDPITAYTIDRLIVDIRKELNVTSLLVSHDVSSVMRVADRIAFLHDGQMIFLGKPTEFESSNEPSIRELIDKARATVFD